MPESSGNLPEFHALALSAGMEVKPSTPRNASIDHIRVFLTALVIMHHAAITFGAPGGWYRMEMTYDGLPTWLKVFYPIVTAVNQSYFMGFFFLLAGYFTPTSLVRKGTGAFLRDRFVRLGIPLAIYAGFLSPVTIGFAQLMKGESFFGGFYWIYVMGNYECGPMWFVQALLIFSLLYILWAWFMPFRQSAPGQEAQLPRRVVLLAWCVGTGLAAFVIRQFIHTGVNIFGMQIGYFATYVVLFYTGCRAARDRWLERVEWRYAMPWIVAASLAIAFLPIAIIRCKDGSLWSGGMNVFAYFYAVWEPVVAWGMILGILWASRTYLAETNRFLQHLARCSFAVFVIHAPVLVGVTLLFHGWNGGSFAKWLVVGLVSCVVSWLVATVIVRIPGLRKVF
jgi:peptidoglycan/LPS O-acetylase OafA/YrhL